MLFISYDGLTDPLGQSQILPYLVGLAKKGHQISVLSCEKKEPFDLRYNSIQKRCDAVDIKWKYIKYRKRPPIISTLLDILELQNTALTWHYSASFDIVHCRTILPTLIGLKLQKRGAKLIFDIRGFWADERVDGKLWDLSNILYKKVYDFVKAKEKLAYQKADHIIALTQSAKSSLQQDFALLSSKIDVVPCTVDLKHFKHSKATERKAEKLKVDLNIKEESTIFCYSGSLGTRYLIEEMLKFFSAIQKKKSDAVFLIITHHSTLELEKIANQLGILEHLRITSTSYAEIPAYLAMADLGLYFIFAGNSGKAVSPTKQAEFLSMGVPIITNAGIGDSELLIQENGVGIVLEDLSSITYEKLSAQLNNLLALPRQKMIQLSEREFNLEKGIATYHQVYSSI